MTDLATALVGAWVTPTLTVSEHGDSTAATLVVVQPDGTTAPGTGENTADTGATWTADPVQIASEGVWILDWTVTGTGKGPGPQRVLGIPAPTPGPAPSPPPLATITDLVETLGRELTATETAKAPRLLSSASALLRGYCRRSFTLIEGGTVVLRPVGTTLRLPNKPVVSVAQVEQIGTAGTDDRVMAAAEWAFDGIDKIELWADPCYSGTAATGSYANTYRVTYDGGASVAPRVIVDMGVGMALRTLLAPTQAEGLVSEHIGNYGYQYGQASGDQSPGATVKLTEADEKQLRKLGYRRGASTIQSRVA